MMTLLIAESHDGRIFENLSAFCEITGKSKIETFLAQASQLTGSFFAPAFTVSGK